MITQTHARTRVLFDYSDTRIVVKYFKISTTTTKMTLKMIEQIK